MKRSIFGYGLLILFTSGGVVASDLNGTLVAEIDSHLIKLPIKCEDTTMMLNSYSDTDVNGKSDSDGDGVYLTLGGIPSMKQILGVFNIQGKEYRFSHKAEFTLKKLVIPKIDVNRKDGSKYSIEIDLSCD